MTMTSEYGYKCQRCGAQNSQNIWLCDCQRPRNIGNEIVEGLKEIKKMIDEGKLKIAEE